MTDTDDDQPVYHPKPVSIHEINRQSTERLRVALAARVNGESWPRVAELAGYRDATVAQNSVEKYLNVAPTPERVQALRDEWAMRLELCWQMAAAAYTSASTSLERSAATRAATAVHARAGKFLGVDADAGVADPVRVLDQLAQMSAHVVEARALRAVEA